MNQSVFLARCDPEHFDRTVGSAIDLAEHPDHPAELSETDAVRLWGAPEGSRNLGNFEKLESGDLVLFYADGSYVGTGRVGVTFEDDDGWASETFWDGAEVTHCYTVEQFTPVSVPAAAVNSIFDYSASYAPPGLLRVSDDKLGNRPAAIERALALYDEGRD